MRMAAAEGSGMIVILVMIVITVITVMIVITVITVMIVITFS